VKKGDFEKEGVKLKRFLVGSWSLHPKHFFYGIYMHLRVVLKMYLGFSVRVFVGFSSKCILT